jgi:hypothetical protein
MVSASEIKDADSLRAWLEGRPRADAVAIAARAALRVAPLYWAWVVHPRQDAKLMETPILRACLSSAIAALRPGMDIDGAIATNANAAADAASSTAKAATPARAAARAVAHSVAPLAVEPVTFGSNAGALAAIAYRYSQLPDIASGVAEAGSWVALTMDAVEIEAGRDPFARPLWPEVSPDWVPMVHRDWRARGGGWVFWADWYEGYLTGKPLDIDLLEKVAQIESEHWDKGDDHVNGIIAGYYDDWRINGLVKKTPNAERVAVNADTGKFYAEPVSGLPSDHLADARDKLAEANAIFEGAEGGNDPYGMLKPERDIIDRALSAYRERPMMLHDACRRASRRVQGKVARGDCPERDPLIEDYVRQLDEVAGDLLAFDPKVKEVVVARVQGAIEAASPEKRQLLVDAAEAGAAASEGLLAEELPADALVATDPAEPLESRKEATYRFTSRIARMYSLGRKGLSEVAGVTRDAGFVGGGLYGLYELWKAIPYLLTLL